MSVHDQNDDTTGYGQVCCPTPTHGQTTKRNELDSSPRMVSTANYDQGNLTPDLCDDVQAQMNHA